MGHDDMRRLAEDIKSWGRELGFSEVGIAGIDLERAETRLLDWLAAGFHGSMDYMARHGAKRARPAELVPGTVSIISARMDYLPESMHDAGSVLDSATHGYVARYALGRDYHKLMRTRLQALCDRIAREIGYFGHRVFSDSAPVMEVELARLAGTGWRGKHTLLLSRQGSWFFLGEIFTDLPLPSGEPTAEHCGTCRACMDICPTHAIVAPYVLDARRCISYLTIEHDGGIPVELRPLIGNRIYGCDDCQLACPWNRHATLCAERDFAPRHGLARPALVELAFWDEATFLRRTEGMAIRRIGHARWLRNLAVALGNGPHAHDAIDALRHLARHPSAMVREHAEWGLGRLAGGS